MPKIAFFDMVFRFASVAQLVEQVTLNHLVLGSSPSRGMAMKEFSNLVFSHEGKLQSFVPPPHDYRLNN